MFQLTKTEFDCLRSQFVTSKRGGRRYNPYVFTEQGVAMLASILNSKKAIELNLQIVRTFVKLRKMIKDDKFLQKRISNIERKVEIHEKAIIKLINEMGSKNSKSIKKIGFKI